jgi:hypothetical protein
MDIANYACAFLCYEWAHFAAMASMALENASGATSNTQVILVRRIAMIAGKSAAELQKILDLVKAMRDVDTAIAPEIGEHILVPKVIPDPKELQNLHDIAHDLHMQEWESKKGRDVVKTMQKNMEEAYPYLVAYGLKSKKITIQELGRYIDLYSIMEGVSKMQRR